MLLFLIFIFVVILINILIIGVLISKISIIIEDLKVNSSGINNIKISIRIYIFKVLKVLSIKINKQYLRIGFIKIYYYQILKYKNKIINDTAILTKLLLGKNRLSLNILNPNIETFNMNLNLCLENAALTSISSSLIGSTTSMILSKYVKKYDKDKIYYKIVPVYFNVNGFKLEIKTKINFNTFNVIIFLFDYYLLKNNK